MDIQMYDLFEDKILFSQAAKKSTSPGIMLINA